MSGDNGGAFSALDRQIAAVHALSELPERVAPKVAKALKAELDAQITKGADPSGAPWKKTKAGATPLTGAARALTVRAVGPTIFAQLRGPEALHHFGFVRGGIRRQILPTRKLPQAAVEAIKRVLRGEFRSAVSG